MNMSSAGRTDVLDGIQRRGGTSRDSAASADINSTNSFLLHSCFWRNSELRETQRNRWAYICCCCCCCSGLDRKTWIRLQNKYQRTHSLANRPCLSDSDLRTFPEDQRFCSKISELPLPDMTAVHIREGKSFFCWLSSDPGAGRDWSLASYPANTNNPLKELYCVSTACKHTYTHLVCSSRCVINRGTALLSTNTKLREALWKTVPSCNIKKDFTDHLCSLCFFYIILLYRRQFFYVCIKERYKSRNDFMFMMMVNLLQLLQTPASLIHCRETCAFTLEVQ